MVSTRQSVFKVGSLVLLSGIIAFNMQTAIGMTSDMDTPKRPVAVPVSGHAVVTDLNDLKNKHFVIKHVKTNKFFKLCKLDLCDDNVIKAIGTDPHDPSCLFHGQNEWMAAETQAMPFDDKRLVFHVKSPDNKTICYSEKDNCFTTQWKKKGFPEAVFSIFLIENDLTPMQSLLVWTTGPSKFTSASRVARSLGRFVVLTDGTVRITKDTDKVKQPPAVIELIIVPAGTSAPIGAALGPIQRGLHPISVK
jgi:hypothetical protein